MKTILLSNHTVYEGSLILVNRQHPYRAGKAEESLVLLPGNDGVTLERRAAVLLSKLMEEIRGWRKIAAVSGWRSAEEQQKIWDSSLHKNGMEFTETYVALPGHSEHQTGLAVDLALRQRVIDFIRPAFPYSGICGTFRKRAALFGFVERYPKGKEETTGIGHEPWHFRYVGMPHAAIMTELGLTLEEYTDFLQQFPYGSRSYEYQKEGLVVAVSYQKAGSGLCTPLEVDTTAPYSVSGNNVNGFIITEWRGRHGRKEELRGA